MIEKENSERRKEKSLTNSEWLTFFFFPFKRFGFDRKLKESVSARRWGMIFYWVLFIIIFYFINFD